MNGLRLALAILMAAGTAGSLPAYGHSVQVQGKAILVDGQPFTVKGIHYGPWRAGTGPSKGYPYPGPDAIGQDLQIIRGLNVNTILVYDPPGYVLDLADRYGLKVLCSFYLNWWPQSAEAASAERDRVLTTVREYREKPALLGWVLGNEISLDAAEQRGSGAIEKSLADLYHAVKAVDPQHPVTHSNWPVAKSLNLSFFDIISYNVYPLWPPEVVALGFDRYIEQVLQPIAADKPLLITEFGADSLEATENGEAQLLGRCWKDLRKAGACGGVVFEFADEWWKNYDNPRRAGNWWDRKAASEDEKTHDLDPEEYYGVVSADRRPKPAFKAVQEMYAGGDPSAFRTEQLVAGVLVSLLILLAGGAWLWAARRTRASAGRQANEVRADVDFPVPRAPRA